MGHCCALAQPLARGNVKPPTELSGAAAQWNAERKSFWIPAGASKKSSSPLVGKQAPTLESRSGKRRGKEAKQSFVLFRNGAT